MKKLILSTVFTLVVSARAQVVFSYSSGFQNDGRIHDGNVNPWSDTRSVTGIAGSITAVTVHLNISGGYNGDLYGYLSYNGVQVPLLNRVGVGTGGPFGYSDTGLNVIFSSAAANNIHFYQRVGGYSITGEAAWQPDGRTINPVTSPATSFDANGTATLAAYTGMSADGSWTLALADLSAGGGQPVVVSWGVEIAAVPEPAETALVTACLTLAAALWRRRRIKQRAP